MSNGFFTIPAPLNEPISEFRPGSPERIELKTKLDEMLGREIEIPMIIGGKDIKSNDVGESRCPHDHRHLLGRYHKGNREHVNMAIQAAMEARKTWSETAWEDRASIFLKAAELLAGPWRQVLNAATMLDQSKNAHQAEIDAACEIVDFLRFNAFSMQELYRNQPVSAPGIWDRMEFRPLEGFVFAISPFNFISLAVNLISAPAIMGNVVLWKPASSTIYAGHYMMQLFKEAGLPDGVINMVPGSGAAIGDPALEHPDLGGVHFTGSTGTFQHLWKQLGGRIEKYRSYPRIVGETGGKDFLFVHNSADIMETAVGAVRGAFEYQGQKCSAASRMYVPKSIWSDLKKTILGLVGEIKTGDVRDFSNFMNAVIDQAAFDSITEYIEYAKNSDETETLTGGGYDDSKGYFIEPTIFVTGNPKFRTMEEEIFGPVLTVYVYEDDLYEETLRICDETSPYGLTGAVFAKDRYAISLANRILRNSAGNFYINDKPTGAVVGQQPFGGARASGTNDKSGTIFNLLRWTSPRTIKENFTPPLEITYPFMLES